MDGSAAGGAKYRLKVFLEKITACCGGVRGMGFLWHTTNSFDREMSDVFPESDPWTCDFDLRWDHRSASSSISLMTLLGEGQIGNREMLIVDSWEYSLMRKIARLLLRFGVIPVVQFIYI